MTNLIRQLVQEELRAVRHPWIAQCTYIVLGRSPWKGNKAMLGLKFPVHVTGLTVNEHSIVASVTLPKGPASELPKPCLTVAINPLKANEPEEPPMWGNMQKLFLGNLVATMTEESGVICLALSQSSREQVIQAAINMGHNITI